MTADLAMMPAHQLVKLFKSRKASPVEAARAALARIEAFNPQLNAFQHLDPDGAISLKQHAGRKRVGHDPQILAPQGWIEVGDRATAAPSAPDRVLAVAKAQLLSAVEIVD